ncbi:hypothetical protein [Mesorhizobium sp.]|uniref:hypothetical protein n=1 Tax=Mesorhizobium sp. TaxID=1871066 RepID=UPI0011FC0519|nr:hypothetical protein [Mesorhizobium sp.]TIM05513.1 MAG: hypothetical protein E5Y62_27365 [Mesorhizobium sp.]
MPAVEKESHAQPSQFDMMRLIIGWLFTAVFVFGCVAHPNRPIKADLQVASIVDLPLELAYWPLFAVLGGLLCLAAWQSQRNRGTCLGIIFGSLAEIVLYRRIEAEYYVPVMLLGAALFTALAIAHSRLARKPAAAPLAVAVAAADGFDALLPDRPAAPNRSRTLEERPRSGLVAFFVTATILLFLDILILPTWLR